MHSVITIVADGLLFLILFESSTKQLEQKFSSN